MSNQNILIGNKTDHHQLFYVIRLLHTCTVCHVIVTGYFERQPSGVFKIPTIII